MAEAASVAAEVVAEAVAPTEQAPIAYCFFYVTATSKFSKYKQ